MADITMCSQHLCPNASHCYRVQAKPSENWQSVCHFGYTITEVDAFINELAEQLQTIRAAFTEIKTLLGETDIHIAAMQQQIAALTALFLPASR